MSELEELLIDRAELDKNLLAEVLLPYIGIDAGRREIVPREGWRRLSGEAKILVFLLGRKAMVAMNAIDMEGALPQEIERRTGVKGGTLRPKLRSMRSDGLLAQEGSNYFVPTHALHRAKDLILGGVQSDEARRVATPAGRRRRAGGNRS